MLIDEKKLKEMPFIAFLKSMCWDAGSLRFVNKNNGAFQDARNIIRLVTHRFVIENSWTWEDFNKSTITRNLNSYGRKLERYEKAKSERRRKEVIEDFTKDYSIELNKIIVRMENKPTNPTL
jgi:hypothetical protein